MSKKREKEISLSEKLSSLIQTKPPAIESDDDDLVTVAKVVPNDNDSDYTPDELQLSTFRRINTGLLEEEDKKYLGKGISRRDFRNAEHSDLSENEKDSSSATENSASEENNSENEEDIDSEVDTSEKEIGENEENIDSEVDTSEEEIGPFDSKSEEKIKPKNKHEGESINKQIFVKAASDIEKGKAIKNQLHIWNFLLECRMKFQKCLVASNQFPNHSNFLKFKSLGSPVFHESVLQCKKSLKCLLNSLLSLEAVLLNSNEDFLDACNCLKKDVKNACDDEVTSDSERGDNVQDERSTVSKYSFKTVKNLNDFSKEIAKRNADFQSYRNNIIQKWNDKTRIGYISNKNFSAFEQSTLKQIEHVLLDKERLIKRTQIKRSNYHILGEEDEEPLPKKAAKSENLNTTSLDNRSKILHKEIFDDEDFYHQLLSELVKRKADGVTDPVQLGRQWMQLQRVRSKMKKTVDTRASKGRKVRYVVHPKLVNFMMPIDSTFYNDDARTELFNSLFGKTKK